MPTRWWRWSIRPAPPVTPVSARAFTGTSRALRLLRPPRTKRPPRSSARSQRAANERPEGSYTVELLDDPARIGAKVREEADEVARAADSESDERVAEEAADVIYHLQVLLRSRDVPLSAVMETLNARRR